MYNGGGADDQAHIIRYLDPSMRKQIKIWRTWALEHEVIAFFPLSVVLFASTLCFQEFDGTFKRLQNRFYCQY